MRRMTIDLDSLDPDMLDEYLDSLDDDAEPAQITQPALFD